MKAIDTNILIRFITKDNEYQSKLVYKLFKQAEQTEQKLFIPLLVVLEVIWVLQSIYEIPDLEIVKTLSDLLAMPVLLFESENTIQNFIDSASHTKFDLSDLLIAHSAYSSNCESIFTFDKKASKFEHFELLK